VRINTDRRAIANAADKPWLYGSNVRGLQRLQLDLQYYKPAAVCLSVGATAPTIDGDLHDPCWNGFGGTPTGGEATLWIRHDAQNLYVASAAAATGAKPAPFAITFGDAAVHTLIAVTTTAGGKLDVKRLDIPEFDRKAAASTLPEITASVTELTGAKAAANAGATELAIPWSALEAAGLKRDTLHASGNPVPFFGRKPSDVTRNFMRTSFRIKPVDDPLAAAQYTVRLHFCEIEAAAPGQRVFDVLLNGKVVAAKLDVAAEAGGPLKALVKEFRGVTSTASLIVELRSPNDAQDKIASHLSAIEVIRE
jgi:hypothetical protein